MTVLKNLTGFVFRPTEEQRKAPIANVPPGMRARTCFANDCFARIVLRTGFDVRLYAAIWRDGAWWIEERFEQRARTRWHFKAAFALKAQCGTLGRGVSIKMLEGITQERWRWFTSQAPPPRHTPSSCAAGMGVQCFCGDCRMLPPVITFDRMPKRALIHNHACMIIASRANPKDPALGLAELARKGMMPEI